MQAISKQKRYTFDDWMSWDEGVRAELIDGELVMMAPPTTRHQETLGAIYAQLHNFLKGKPCRVFPAPVGVRLNADKDTAFEPDIVVVCDKEKLDGKIVNGAPDMVIEVLSLSTARHDKFVKYLEYQNAGVREYWIVDPHHKTVDVNILQADGRYALTGYGDDASAPVHVLEGCEINLAYVFAEG